MSLESGRALSALRDEITSMVLRPDTPLVESELAARFGVSRTPLRDVLGVLRREGLVVQESGQSARVAPLTAEDAVAIYQARDALEGYALRLAAERDESSRFDELAEAFDSLYDDPTVDAVDDLSSRFDRAVVDAADSPVIASLLADLQGRIRRLRQISVKSEGRLAQSCRERSIVARAVAVGNGAEAARANTARLREGLDDIVEALLGSLLSSQSGRPISRGQQGTS